MDSLGSILGPLFTTGSGLSKVLTGGLFGAGEIGNLIEEKKRAAYQNYVMNLLNNPQKLSQMAVATEKPLDNALIQSVGNTVQGNMASRGLSQAPGIFAATESQALAPYAEQNYNTALNAIMQTLGLPAQTFGKPTDMSGALKLFLGALNPQQNPNSGNIFADVGSAPWTPTGPSMQPQTPVNPFPSGVVPTFDPNSIGAGGMP